MAKKKSVKLENLTAIYDAKNNTTAIIGEKGVDGGFKVLLKKGSTEDKKLREKLFEEELNELNFKQLTYPEGLTISKDKIPLGLNANQEKVFWNLSTTNSLIISGSTAVGKTTLLNHVQAMLNRSYGIGADVYMVGEEMNHTKYVEITEKTIAHVYREMNNRYREIKSDKNITHSPIFLLIDELERIVEKNNITQRIVTELLRKGRAANIHLVISSHSSSAPKIAEHEGQEICISMRHNAETDKHERYAMIITEDETILFNNYTAKKLNY